MIVVDFQSLHARALFLAVLEFIQMVSRLWFIALVVLLSFLSFTVHFSFLKMRETGCKLTFLVF